MQVQELRTANRRPHEARKPSMLHRSGGLVVVMCTRLAESVYFSLVTTTLTIYALFGDDIRLGLTTKPADETFDSITIACMAVFGFEIIVCSIGKAGYIFGFFFILDVASTLTLLLDITTISEDLFGDTLSGDGAQGATSDSGAGDSAEAARAARMSRAGTKAGRVVRLIRIMRLIRLLRAFRSSAPYQARPGEDWDADKSWDQQVEKESVVSKKLSEMTTRRVIMLVLAIMLVLPFFQSEVYTNALDGSAQYGANVLYRRLLDDVVAFDVLSSSLGELAYVQSRQRQLYEDDFLMYVYYHNSLCSAGEVPDGRASPLSRFAKLFWLGGSPGSAPLADYFLPGHSPKTWDARWSGEDWEYYQCTIPSSARALLEQPWSTTTRCLSGQFRGVSLLQFRESVACPDELRWQERVPIYPTSLTTEERLKFVSLFVFDRRSGSRMEAALNTGQTVFICLLLGVGAMTFSNDANKLVLMPIERMISKLDQIRRNPLEAMTIGDEEHHREQVLAHKSNKHRKVPGMVQEGHLELLKNLQSKRSRFRRLLYWIRTSLDPQVLEQAMEEPMETVVLEKTIIKIGSLLALGFGEAGSEIIVQNMKGSDSSAINAMIPGRRVEALFGFCDIRNFTDATEVLQDQVMVFVNRIASVVHSCITEYFGSPNKNVGDAFLLVWRLSGHTPTKQRRLADMSIVSFIKIIAQINKSPLLAEYRLHPKLVKRLPNYRVRMGFGLHSGWAIEGAIGSEFKIDASYLSPNVNMAARLEGLTKSYGCLMLISCSLVQLCSERVAQECRLIDHVSVAGRKQPFKLYTLDLDDLVLEVDRVVAVAKTREAKFKARYEQRWQKNQRWQEDFDMHALFGSDADIRMMRSKFTVEFFCRFNMAYLNYEAGNWSVAKSMLEGTRFMLATEDGPSSALLRFIKQHGDDAVAPKSWPGYRLLHDH